MERSKFIEVECIASNTKHDKRKNFIRTDTINQLSECGEEHIIIGGSCVIVVTSDSLFVCTEPLQEVYEKIIKAESH